MIHAIESQITANRHLNLFFDHLDQVLSVTDTFRTRILDLKKQDSVDIEQLIEQTARQSIQAIYQINQYIDIPEQDMDELKQIYRITWDEIDTHNFDAIMRAHHYRLADWLARFYPDAFIKALKQQPQVGAVLNKSYSAEFQLQVLNIDVETLQAPVLDIGCGPEGNLVRELVENGIDAIGIDRIINSPETYLIESNWFDFDLRQKSWGTVISNMGFSNHLVYCLRNEPERVSAYLLRYREILDSLKPCGEFIYAPSIPVVEERLDSRSWQVVRNEVTPGIWVTRIIRRV